MSQMAERVIRLTVNGKTAQFAGDLEMPLLWYLREDAQLTGAKLGCGKGLCGACTVHINGEAARSCITPMSAVAGKRIRTIEGLSANGEHILQKAWRECSVPQCGFCQAGQIMQAAALLSVKPKPSDAEIASAMAGNLCRCGTYQRIRQAIQQAAGLKA